MSSTLYLQRKLISNETTYTEASLLDSSNFIIVLAEPGGGKTELLKSFARQLGVSSTTASVFGFTGAEKNNSALVIDAFDELAKVDQAGIQKLLAFAKKANPTRVIVSSRSSEWDNASTNMFYEFLDHTPLVVRLCEFDEEEQRKIFEHFAEGEDFKAFRDEVARFDLEMLLPNPQFLILFADAYVESERHFTSKHSLFSQAVERLAKEANKNILRNRSTLSTSDKVRLSSEIFAKILLSGAVGISTIEDADIRSYPLLESLTTKDNLTIGGVLATRLFKPSDHADRHIPVHKIVVEYCAADYLTRRIVDPADSLTLSKCLAIIAPSSTVRDELRGLLGWMASLGNRPIEEALIELDPYAVLANGDPSQLEHSSKRLLIDQLRKVESIDPYFRRGDFWRRFSVAGFFTQEVINEIKPILRVGSDGHLRDLILEMLVGSSAVQLLSKDFRKIILDVNENENTRLLANKCLLQVSGYNYREVLRGLLTEASSSSLRVCTHAFETFGLDSFDMSDILNFFNTCAYLYQITETNRESMIGSRYFLRTFIAILDLQTIEELLNELTSDIVCSCGKESYDCECRLGISKIVGLLLDRYFDVVKKPNNPIVIWKWIEKLSFQTSIGTSQSKAVHVLQNNDDLRQSILAHVLGGVFDQEVISQLLGWHLHSGLSLRPVDFNFIVDFAYNTGNTELWAHFIPVHNQRVEDFRKPNRLRSHMRKQAQNNPLFMRKWAKCNNAREKFKKEHRNQWINRSRRVRRLERKKEETTAANIKFIQENRKLVEAGRHLRCLEVFSRAVLSNPGTIEYNFGSESIVRNALMNCIDFIAPRIPNLIELAKLNCTSQGHYSEPILLAACLEIFRVKGNLESVDPTLLKALRTNIHMSYHAVSEADRDALYAEVDRLIFPSAIDAEKFLREYIEPQLEQVGCNHPELWMLNNQEVFSSSRQILCVEWLWRFPDLALGPLITLFDISAQFGDRGELKKVISERSAEYMSRWPNPTGNKDIEEKRIFWFVRAWYFLDSPPKVYWDWLKTDKNTIFLLSERSGRLTSSDYSGWPKLTPSMAEDILEAFIDEWPKVDLPSHWGSESPTNENAYRFLTEVVWSFNSDNLDTSIHCLERLLSDSRFEAMHQNMKTIRADQVRKKALRDFEPPIPADVVKLLDRDDVVTVAALRQMVIQELKDFQRAILGGEFNSASRFYEKGERRDEVQSTEIIAERLNLRLEPRGISVTPEHQLKGASRSDFTVTKMIEGKRKLLVTEVKGQWHSDLYSAAATQLNERYSIHPDAEQQGIYLVIWFGKHEMVARRKKHDIKNAEELKRSIVEKLPSELIGSIDVFVLDVSNPILT